MILTTEEYVLDAISRKNGKVAVISLWSFENTDELDERLIGLADAFQISQDATISVVDMVYRIDVHYNSKDSGFISIEPLSKTRAGLSKIDKLAVSPVICDGMPDLTTGFCTKCGKVHRIATQAFHQQRRSLSELQQWWRNGLEEKGVKLVKAPDNLPRTTTLSQNDLPD